MGQCFVYQVTTDRVTQHQPFTKRVPRDPVAPCCVSSFFREKIFPLALTNNFVVCRTQLLPCLTVCAASASQGRRNVLDRADFVLADRKAKIENNHTYAVTIHVENFFVVISFIYVVFRCYVAHPSYVISVCFKAKVVLLLAEFGKVS